MELLFASRNLNKLEEVQSILNNHKIISLKQLNDEDEVEETGLTFRENAYLKAKYFYDKYKKAVFADDSGLIVEALKTEPGINSARYAGVNASDEENNQKLLKRLENETNRKAYFITVICYIDKLGEVHYFEGKVNGEIINSNRGKKGFGYDPIFYLPELNKTFAELGEIKNKLSHRFKALSNLNEYLNKEV